MVSSHNRSLAVKIEAQMKWQKLDLILYLTPKPIFFSLDHDVLISGHFLIPCKLFCERNKC